MQAAKGRPLIDGTAAGWTLERNWEAEKGASDGRESEAVAERKSMSEGVFLASIHCVCGTQAREQDQSSNPELLENEAFHFGRFSKYLKQITLNVYIHRFRETF